MDFLCKKCNQIKDILKFYTKEKDYCIDCYLFDKQSKLELNRIRQLNSGSSKYTKIRQDRINWIRDYKRNIPCKDCGKIYEPELMDYDHLRDKYKSISRMILDNSSKDSILKEIAKCELVCLYCHNLRTKSRINSIRVLKDFEIRNLNIIRESKSVDCYECGFRYDDCNMQFDHIDPSDKLIDVCRLKDCSEERLRKEISKCRVICAMCHRKKSLIEQKEKKYCIEKKIKMPMMRMYDNGISKQCRSCNKIKLYIEYTGKICNNCMEQNGT